MIYLDNAATTLHKPPEVSMAIRRAMEVCGGAGRGGHPAAEAAAELIYDCREALAQLFSMKDPTRVILTQNATHALNIAIQGMAKPGGRVVISGLEHNAVYRPLVELQRKGVTMDIVPTPLFDPLAVYENFARALEKEADLVVCIHVSNVFGSVLPVEDIAALCRGKGVPLIIDASQSAGLLPIAAGDYAVWCMPGHKGLYGPQGTGVLLLPPELRLPPLLQGGTGGDSRSPTMPDYTPEGLEAGTQNAPGAAGLLAGVRFLLRNGGRDPHVLLRKTASRMQNLPGVRVFAGEPQCGALSFTVEDMDSETAAEKLGAHGVAVRAGLHCAPLAHKSAGTWEEGTVRVSFSRLSTPREAEGFLSALKRIVN